MVKAVIFDLGSVLIKGPWRSVYNKIGRKFKISDKKTFSIIQPIRDKWSKGKINDREFWQKLEEKIGKRLPTKFKKDLWFKDYIRKDIKGTWRIATDLSKKGLRLALLSNITPPSVKANKITGRFKRLRELGFDTFILSCEIGCRKPEAKIYKITLKRLGLLAKECVFIDDRIENIKAAKKLGIKGIHFKNPILLKKALIKLNLL